MNAFNRVKAIKCVRAYIRDVMEPMIDNARLDSSDIQPWTKDAYAEHIREVTGLGVIKGVVDGFSNEFVETCDNCRVIRAWFDEKNGSEHRMTLTVDGVIRNEYGAVVTRLDPVALEMVKDVIKEKNNIISGEVEF